MKQALIILSLIMLVFLVTLTGCNYLRSSEGKAWAQGATLVVKQASAETQILTTHPVYRCWYNDNNVVNHYLSFDARCEGGTTDGRVGYLYDTQKYNTALLYDCYRQTRYDHRTYKDNFITSDPACEGQSFNKRLGYAPIMQTEQTIPVYRCWSGDRIDHGKFDHMVSLDANCEGYSNKEGTYYFLKEAQYRQTCTGDVKSKLKLDQTETYNAKGTEYEVTPVYIGDYDIQFKVNGEITKIIPDTESAFLADGTKITVEEIRPRDSVAFCLSTIKKLILVNDGAPAEDVVIGVDAASYLSITTEPAVKLDSEVTPSSLYDYDIIVRIFISDVNVLVNPAKIPETTAQDLVNHLQQNPRVTNVNYKVLSEMTVRDLVDYSQTGPVQQEVSITATGGNYTGTLLLEGQSFGLNYNPAIQILTVTYPDSSRTDRPVDSNNRGTFLYQGKSYKFEIDLTHGKIIFTY